MSSAGTHPRPLTAPVLIDDFSPAWSRSTGRIYFIRTSYINSVRPDGSGEGRITAVLSGVPIHDMAVHAR
jgi:hypothetical protein